MQCIGLGLKGQQAQILDHLRIQNTTALCLVFKARQDWQNETHYQWTG